MIDKERLYTRRKFLKKIGEAGVGMALLGCRPQETPEPILEPTPPEGITVEDLLQRRQEILKQLTNKVHYTLDFMEESELDELRQTGREIHRLLREEPGWRLRMEINFDPQTGELLKGTFYPFPFIMLVTVDEKEKPVFDLNADPRSLFSPDVSQEMAAIFLYQAYQSYQIDLGYQKEAAKEGKTFGQFMRQNLDLLIPQKNAIAWQITIEKVIWPLAEQKPSGLPLHPFLTVIVREYQNCQNSDNFENCWLDFWSGSKYKEKPIPEPGQSICSVVNLAWQQEERFLKDKPPLMDRPRRELG